MKTSKIVLLAFMLYSGRMLAQTPPPIELPQIIGPPPEAAAYARYGDVPVDYSTGVPKIEIPLYTVKSRKLSLPITLSYHAGGNKVLDEASSAGLGWVLNAGGIITRTVIDKADGIVGQNLHYTSKTQLDNAVSTAISASTYATDPAVSQIGENIYEDHEYYDSSSDRYYFALPGGENGIFRYDIFSATPKAIQAPYSTVKINTEGTYPSSVTGYTLTDASGTVYKFNTTGTNSWHLDEMISADQTDNIKFYYNHSNSGAAIGLTQTFDTGPWWVARDKQDCQPTMVGTMILWEKNTDTEFIHTDNAFPWYGTGETPLIDRIETSTCIVRFYYDSRSDIAGTLRLSQVKVFNRSTNALIKEYDLTHSYFGSTTNHNLRLRLDEVDAKNTSSSVIEKHSFEYNTTELPAYPTLTNKSFCEDYWGYYNGSNTTGAIPRQFLPSAHQFDPTIAADKNVNPDYNQAEILKTIYYPTGGKTTFEYESNEGATYNYPAPYDTYAYNYSGGLRVKTIKSYTSAGSQPIIKTYKYLAGGNNINIDAAMFSYDQRYVFIDDIDGRLSDPMAEGTRQVFMSTPILPLTNSSASVTYSNVEEYNGTEDDNTGKTVYDYTDLEPINPVEIITTRFKNASQFDIGNSRPNLSHKTTYKRLDNGTYQVVYALDNTYTTVHGTASVTGFAINKLTNYIGTPSGSSIYYWPESSFPTTPDNTWYCLAGFSNDPASSVQYFHQLECYNSIVNDEVQILNKSVEITLDDNGHYVAKTDYYNYNNLDHLQPTKKTTILSTGDSILTRYKYPHDFSGTQPYTDMVNTYHIWSPVIEQLEYKNVEDSGHFLQSTMTDYASWNSHAIQIYPATTSTKKGSGSYESRIQYHGYDGQGNVQSVSKVNSPKMNYIWGYGGTYPVALVTNADFSAIVTALGGQTAIDAFRDNTNPSDATVNTFLGPLRSLTNLPNAQVTTYTYNPLIGMTSMTDPRGNKTSYEYDSFQRLTNVKDQDGNIKIRYCYNYAGQAIGCLVASTPVPPDPTPDPPVGLYVRVEISDIGYEYSGDETEYSSFQTGNVCIKLYSDPACTIPLTLSYDLPVVMDISDDILDDVNGNSTEPDFATYTITAGNSSYCLGLMDLDDYSHYLDEFGNPHYQEFIYHYNLVPGSTVYRNKPTVTY